MRENRLVPSAAAACADDVEAGLLVTKEEWSLADSGDAAHGRVGRRAGRRRHGASRAIWLLVLLLAGVAGPCLPGAADLPRVSALALFKGKAVLLIDGVQRTLKEGEQSPEGVTLIKATSKLAEIGIGEERYELGLDGRISGVYAQGAAPQVVRLVPGVGGHYFVDGQINSNPVRFLVDTGATSVAMNKHTARRIGLQYSVDGTKGIVRTASGDAVAYSVILDEVKVRAVRLTRVKGTVVDGDHPLETLLGQSFLNRLDMRREGAMMELRER